MRSLALFCSTLCWAQQAPPEPAPEVVFRSDTALVRVDVQVLEGSQPVTGLDREAFLLKEGGQTRRIMNFAREEMPIDLLFLIDVSGSMRPHVERMADAAGQALPSLRKEDRVAIMVFDRMSRLRMPFRGASEAQREFVHLLRTESFNGGTDITRGMLDAVRTMRKYGRKEARHAIVMLTDDQTEFEADEPRVVRELASADTVMSVLLVPDVMGTGRRMPRSRTGSGGGWPGSGWPGRGGVIIGIPGWPGGGGGGPVGGPGGGPMGSRTQSAESAEIARASGGDAMQADEASALETTLQRLRQRYALFFNLPPGVREGETRSVDVSLEATVRRRYPGAELRYRRTYVAAASTEPAGPEQETVISEVSENSAAPKLRREQHGGIPEDSAPPPRRRATSDGSGAPKGPMIP